MKLQLVYRYILSLSKNENMFYEKNTKQTKGPKNKKKKWVFLTARVEPGTIDVQDERVIYRHASQLWVQQWYNH